MISPADKRFVGIPWKDGGCGFDGANCAGLALLFLNEQQPGPLPSVSTPPEELESFLAAHKKDGVLQRGDVVFFRHQHKNLWHVATFLGPHQILHIVQGCRSRVDGSFELLRRLGFVPVSAISPADGDALRRALGCPAVGNPGTIALLALGLALSAASTMLAPRPAKLDAFKARQGVYSDNALVTQRNPELPLPEIYGNAVIAGSQLYVQVRDDREAADVDDSMWNVIILLAAGPVQEIVFEDIKINNRVVGSDSFYDDAGVTGIQADDQTKSKAVTGDYGGTKGAPTLTVYDAAHAISVPVDVRASYDRLFPVHGFAGCTYLVLRCSNTDKFSSLNFTVKLAGLKLRTFNGSGFISATASAESLTGADGTKVRFKLAYDDIISVSSLTVNGTSHAEISASAQTGNVYQLNRTKGYVEFITAPANGATITVTYTYYPRVFSRNPAVQIVEMLTGAGRGFGLAESAINWTAFDDFQDDCDASLTYSGPDGAVTEAAWLTDYSVDDRRPVVDHIQHLLDASHAILFESNGKISLKSLANSESSLFDFDATNVVNVDGVSSATLSAAERAQRPNRITLFYQSEEALNSENEVVADDDFDQQELADLIGNEGVIGEELKMLALTSKTQAERLAEILVRESVAADRDCTWTTDVQGLALEPGDVVTLTHAGLGLTTPTAVRIQSIEHDAEDRLVLTGTKYVFATYF